MRDKAENCRLGLYVAIPGTNTKWRPVVVTNFAQENAAAITADALQKLAEVLDEEKANADET